jgi:hypothetical protein
MSINRFYIDCVRYRVTETVNEVNGKLEKTSNPKAIKGYMGSGTSQIVNIADKDTLDMRYKFYCNDFDILEDDIINYENQYYKVISKPHNSGRKNHHIKCMVRRTDNIQNIM